MFIRPRLIASSEQRFKKANFSPAELDKKLGDGHPIPLTPERIQLRRRQLLEENNDDPMKAQLGLERIINGNDLDSTNYLLKRTRAASSICRIQLKDGGSNLVGYASGFVIGPGVLMTNHHVFGAAQDAVNSIADFDYELDIDGVERQPTRFGFEPGQLFYTNEKLDYSVRCGIAAFAR
jgi:endonuclease G, mitochondrial